MRAANQAPALTSPVLWPKFYWQLRTLPTYVPPPAPSSPSSTDSKANGDDDDDEAHLAADIATGLTANASSGLNPATYTMTLIYRNLDAKKLGSKNNELIFLHEPNVSIQISPDPNSSAVYQAAVTLVNLHLKRNWGLIQPDIELSVSGTAGLQGPGNTPTGGVQGAVEVHVTSKISVTAGTSLGLGPPSKAERSSRSRSLPLRKSKCRHVIYTVYDRHCWALGPALELSE